MSGQALIQASKFMSYALRHAPAELGLAIDTGGWVSVDELVACSLHHEPLTAEIVRDVVASSEKRRFSLSPDGSRVRAVQGHSIEVDLGLEPRTPPAELFHGTAARFLDSIERDGLVPGQRQQVHLSADATTASAVGARHGTPVVLAIDTGAMTEAGVSFFRAENDVWLVDAVEPRYLRRVDGPPGSLRP